jgi:hypothetical protein
MRAKFPATVGAAFVLLGCLWSSPTDAAQLPAASEQKQADADGQPNKSAVRQKTPAPPAIPVFQTEVLVTAKRRREQMDLSS